MQLEDVLRIRRSDEQVRQHRIEAQQEVLLKQLQQALKRKTSTPTETTNRLLEKLISQLNN